MNLQRVISQKDQPVEKRIRQVEDCLSTTEIRAQVELRHASPEGRKVRSDSTQAYDPTELCLIITFTPRRAESSRFAPLVRSLEAARSGKEFVSLKWFRDKFLPTQPAFQSCSEPERHQALLEAIEQGIVLTGSVPDPDPKKPHITTVTVNYSHSEVLKIFGQNERSSVFRPVKIQGEPLSHTVSRDRR